MEEIRISWPFISLLGFQPWLGEERSGVAITSISEVVKGAKQENRNANLIKENTFALAWNLRGMQVSSLFPAFDSVCSFKDLRLGWITRIRGRLSLVGGAYSSLQQQPT